MAAACSDSPLREAAIGNDLPSAFGQDNDDQSHTISEIDLPSSAATKPVLTTRSGLFAFSNSEEIKARVRSQKLKPNPYNVHDAYHARGFFQWLAKHERFENCTLGVIVINALWISVDTDGNIAETMLDARAMYNVADSLFFFYFCVELIVRFFAFESKFDCLRDGWFKFDTTLVVLYAFDPFTIAIIAAASGGGGLDLPTAILRLFRLARLSRLVRMLRSLPELMVMIQGMATASASVGYTLGLLILITYVFAIALRNLVPAGSLIEETYFSSVPEAMHNLIIFGTFMDALSDFIWELKDESPACLILSWLYIALANLTVLNMLVGVLCEVISAVAEEENESLMVYMVYEKFAQVIHDIDGDGDGTISWEEFKKIPSHPEALQILESVDVDAETMIDIAEDFFHDDKGQQKNVTFEEFMSLVLDLRGGQQATVKDVMKLGMRGTEKFLTLSAGMDKLEGKLDRLLGHFTGANAVVEFKDDIFGSRGSPIHDSRISTAEYVDLTAECVDL